MSSPIINTEKVNAKKRKVFKDSKGRTYVKQGDKKVFVKKLFTPQRNPTPVRKTKPAKNPVINTEKTIAIKRKAPLDLCSTPGGLMQKTGTCWFNSSLNGFVLADGTAKLIYDQIQKLSSTEIASLAKSFPEDSCPLMLSKKYIYHYFLKIHGREVLAIQKAIENGNWT